VRYFVTSINVGYNNVSAMTDHTNTHWLYVLLVSRLGTVLSLPAVWYFTADGYAARIRQARREAALKNRG
jgi:hypothetical protein